MKTFKEWLKLKEMMTVVSCKDLNNSNFQIAGSLSNLNCKKKQKKHYK